MRVPYKFESWDALYREQDDTTMPWYYEGIDPDFAAALKEFDISGGKILDLGSGPGLQSIHLAKKGFEVTASDISPTAIKNAGRRAASENVTVDYRLDNILDSKITETFDLVFDRGVFHIFDPEEHDTYRSQISNWLKPGGYFFLKCFGPNEPGTDGPYRRTPEAVVEIFGDYFSLHSHKETIYYGTRQPPPQAVFYVFKK